MKNLLKVLCNVSFILFLSFALTMIFQNTVYAGTNTKLYVNGYHSENYPSPLLKDGHSYVPLNTAENLLGYYADYDDIANTLTLLQPDLNIHIKMNIGSNSATVNNEKKDLPYAPFIISDEPMVSLRFLAVEAGGKVVWESMSIYENMGYSAPSENRIYIYSSHPVKLDSGNASLSSNIYYESQSLIGSDGRERNIGYDVVIPVLSEMKDAEFQKQLNDKFITIYSNIKNESEDIYAKQVSDDFDFIFDSSNDLRFIIVNDGSDGLMSLLFDEYVYTGGAHGMPYKFVYNIDFNKSELLSLSNLIVEGKDYVTKLVDEMNSIRMESLSEEYDYVDEVKGLPSTQIPYEPDAGFFYIKNDTLHIFYHPYELSFYARGFVDFRISLNNLREYILDDYI